MNSRPDGREEDPEIIRAEGTATQPLVEQAAHRAHDGPSPPGNTTWSAPSSLPCVSTDRCWRQGCRPRPRYHLRGGRFLAPPSCLPPLLHVGVRDPSPGFRQRRAGWREAWGMGGQGCGRLLGHHTTRHRKEATPRVGQGKAPLTPSRARWTPVSPGPDQSSEGTSAP